MAMKKSAKGVLTKLEIDGYKIPWLIANEKAEKLNKRFIDFDLSASSSGLFLLAILALDRVEC